MKELGLGRQMLCRPNFVVAITASAHEGLFLQGIATPALAGGATMVPEA
ncbi:MAG TPA: hypothetical protein VK206_12325 [Anaerolineales bacterium]|nr:hypothetical protein [Anaerolineales bacterium]HLO33300.1 hypothetical protein [Anaerolineales bacterium]